MPPPPLPSGGQDAELFPCLRDREDLLYEVLLRLPPKAVSKFRCVCKKWLELTTSSIFASSYAARHTANPRSWFLLPSRPLMQTTTTRRSSLLRLSISEPPAVSSLSISHRLWPGYFAYSGGLFLVCSTDDYYVCNPFTGDAFRLPPANPPLGYFDSMGLVARDGEYVVAEYRDSCLRCFSSRIGRWEEKAVPCPEFLRKRDAVVSFNGRLHWIDLRHGILSCDPFADKPIGEFVELPETHPGPSTNFDELMSFHTNFYRYVGVAGGRLCFLEVDDGEDCLMSLWALEGNGTSGGWVLQYKVNFADIWADKSYADCLPKEVPLVGLVNPLEPHIVYFMVGGFLFAVDAGTRRVVSCYEYGSPQGEVACLALMPCVLPPLPASLSPYPAGLEKKERGIKDGEDNGSCSKPVKSAKGRRKQKK